MLCGVHVRRRVGEQQPQALARSRAPRLENYDPLLLLRPLPLQMIIITDTSLLLLLLRLLLLLLLLPLVLLLRLLRLLPILLLLILLLQLTITRNLISDRTLTIVRKARVHRGRRGSRVREREGGKGGTARASDSGILNLLTLTLYLAHRPPLPLRKTAAALLMTMTRMQVASLMRMMMMTKNSPI